nr:carbohydrate binding family 9 domain-containing protein [Acidobacteriota bacterium]
MRRISALLAVCLTTQITAQSAPTTKVVVSEKREFQAVRAAKSPIVDGDLSDEAWQNAPELTGFTQREPDEGKPATQQTRVKVVYDDDAIYFGAFMEDAGPVTPLLARRDTDFGNGDFIKFSVDSQHDRQNGAAFIVNASNVQSDSILFNDIADDSSWDGVWNSATKITDKGWFAEVRVPFSQLRFPDRETHTWGFNVTRWNARLHEMSRLVFTPRTETGFVSRFGDLSGISGVHPKRSLEVVPYGVARTDLRSRPDNPFVESSAHRADAGVDVKYGLTSNLTLTGTINPDFGQVEVDPAVLNLSQFETFFPEKRPFFTEGASVFRFGNSPAQSRWGFNVWFPTFFYSRRIGRVPQGWIDEADYVDTPSETTILGAAKITGKLGKGWSVGLLDALTDREQAWFRDGAHTGKTTVEPMTNYLVGRATKEYGKDSRAGFMFTSVNRRLSENLKPELRESAYFAGADGYTRFKDKTWLIDWYAGTSLIEGSAEAIERAQKSSARYYARPDASHVELDPTRTSLTGWAARSMLAKQKGKWRPNIQVQALSPGFEINDVGFLPRTDAISTHALVQYVDTDAKKYTREINAWVGKYQNWNFDGDRTANGLSSELYLQLKNYWYVDFGLSGGERRMDDRITRGGPVML